MDFKEREDKEKGIFFWGKYVGEIKRGRFFLKKNQRRGRCSSVKTVIIRRTKEEETGRFAVRRAGPLIRKKGDGEKV